MINPSPWHRPGSPLAPTMAVAVVMTLARTDDPTLQRWARSHRPHLHQCWPLIGSLTDYLSLAASTCQ
jgi:hypothetical protein